ncbi:MAG: thioesterase family protein [Rhodanobacteraceae bacterium]
MSPTESTATPMFHTPVEVRWGDMDAYNHVNNARYLTYLEQARLAWLNTLDRSWLGPHCAPVLAAAQVNYRKPITWPASVEVILECQRLGSSSVTVGHRIIDADKPDTLYCDGHTVLVWIDPQAGTPVPLPDVIRKAIQTAPAS